MVRGGDGAVGVRTGEALTEREIEVLRALWECSVDKAVAERLFLSVKTVQWHLRSARLKLGVHDRLALCRVAMERGVLACPVVKPTD